MWSNTVLEHTLLTLERFWEILASTYEYDPGPYDPGPLGPYGPGFYLKEFSKSNMLQDHIWNALCSRSIWSWTISRGQNLKTGSRSYPRQYTVNKRTPEIWTPDAFWTYGVQLCHLFNRVTNYSYVVKSRFQDCSFHKELGKYTLTYMFDIPLENILLVFIRSLKQNTYILST